LVGDVDAADGYVGVAQIAGEEFAVAWREGVSGCTLMTRRPDCVCKRPSQRTVRDVKIFACNLAICERAVVDRTKAAICLWLVLALDVDALEAFLCKPSVRTSGAATPVSIVIFPALRPTSTYSNIMNTSSPPKLTFAAHSSSTPRSRRSW